MHDTGACGILPPVVTTRPSSFRACTAEDQGACDLEELCNDVYFDLYDDTGYGGYSRGDQKCHRRCDDGDECADGEVCELTEVYSGDGYSSSDYQWMCHCDDWPCDLRGPEGVPWEPEGGLAAWRAEPALAAGRRNHAVAATTAGVYVAGGREYVWISDDGATASSATTDTIVFASNDTDGVLDPWVEAGTLPDARHSHAIAAWNGRLYVVGGHLDWTDRVDVHSAVIEPSGLLGVWRPEADLPVGRSEHRLLAGDDVLVVAGGVVDGGWEETTELLVATPGADGTIAAWSTLQAPEPVHSGGSVVVSGRLYMANEDADRIWSIGLDALDAGLWREEVAYAWRARSAGSSPDVHDLRWSASCDVLVMVNEEGLAVTVPLLDDGVLGEARLATRLYSGIRSQFEVAAGPNGRVYVVSGSAGFAPIVDMPEVWSTRVE